MPLSTFFLLLIGSVVFISACPSKTEIAEPILSKKEHSVEKPIPPSPNAFGVQLIGISNRKKLNVVIKTDPPVKAETHVQPLTTELTRAFGKCNEPWPKNEILQLNFPRDAKIKSNSTLETCLYDHFVPATLFKNTSAISILMREATK